MNMKLDYSKTINEQIDTFNYYKNRYANYELEILKLQQENQKLKKQLDYLRSGEYYNQLRFERDMLEHVVDNAEVSKEDREFIDMTHRNTELLEENQELKKQLDCALKILSEMYPPCEIDSFNMKEENLEYCSQNCSVDEAIFVKCWNRFIEQELEKR